nr:hypothetical protein [Armatimonadota bacterium]
MRRQYHRTPGHYRPQTHQSLAEQVTGALTGIMQVAMNAMTLICHPTVYAVPNAVQAPTRARERMH